MRLCSLLLTFGSHFSVICDNLEDTYLVDLFNFLSRLIVALPILPKTYNTFRCFHVCFANNFPKTDLDPRPVFNNSVELRDGLKWRLKCFPMKSITMILCIP